MTRESTTPRSYSNTSHVIVYPPAERHENKERKDSNTSHVIVYRTRSAAFLPDGQHSNTSHVIVYLLLRTLEIQVEIIQIHLMLLFIFKRDCK